MSLALSPPVTSYSAPVTMFAAGSRGGWCGLSFGRCLFWGSKSRRRKPRVHVRGCFGPPGFADFLFALSARWKQFGFLAQAFRFFGKAGFKRFELFKTATQHDTTSCLRVLTVEFALLVLICRSRAICSRAHLRASQANVMLTRMVAITIQSKKVTFSKKFCAP
jgi:hypothetical protein